MIFRNEKTCHRYFLYTADEVKRIIFKVEDKEGKEKLLAFVLRGETLCFEGSFYEKSQTYKEYLDNNKVYNARKPFLRAFEITEDNHLRFSHLGKVQFIRCLYLKVAGEQLEYEEQYVGLMDNQRYSASYPLWCKMYSDMKLSTDFPKEFGKRNNRVILRILKDMMQKFPYLHLPESILSIPEKEIRQTKVGEEEFGPVSLEQILMHKYYYDTNKKYQELVDNGLGYVAFQVLRHNQDGVLLLDADGGNQFNALYEKLKGKRFEDMREDVRDMIWYMNANEVLLTLLLLDGLNDWQIEQYLKIVGRRYEDYFIFEEIRKYMPKNISLDEAIILLEKSVHANNYSLFLVENFLSLLRRIALTESIDTIRKYFENAQFQDWKLMAIRSVKKHKKMQEEKIRKTFCIEDYRKECRLSGDVDDHLRVEFVADAKNLTEEEIKFFVKNLPELKDNYVLYQVIGKGSVVRNAFLLLGLKEWDLQVLDVEQNMDYQIKKQEVDNCWDFLNAFQKKFHNLYLANHKII